MGVISLHDRAQIRALLNTDPELHTYSLGDLDDFFWPYTTWYSLDGSLECPPVALVYSGGDLPVLLAIDADGRGAIRELVDGLRTLLPRRIYAHFSDDLAHVLDSDYHAESHGTHFKMALRNHAAIDKIDTGEVFQLLPADLPEVEAFYTSGYPGNWFDPRMLNTGQYYGVRRNNRLASVAGIHVYSPAERVAALGNVATLPELRGQGLARLVCAHLTKELLKTVDHVGLNVKADNRGAIAVYEHLGFQTIATYEECMLEAIR